jgi:hypothetical protein
LFFVFVFVFFIANNRLLKIGDPLQQLAGPLLDKAYDDLQDKILSLAMKANAPLIIASDGWRSNRCNSGGSLINFIRLDPEGGSIFEMVN